MATDRRRVLQGALAMATAPASVAASATAQAPRQRALMKVGTQHVPTSGPKAAAGLKLMSALGVSHICGNEPSMIPGPEWSVESLTQIRERVESYGIKLNMLPLPLSSVPLSSSPYKATLLGKSPERDREIDSLCGMIRNTGRAGIPALKYNFTVLGWIRSESTPGRGGSKYSTLQLAKAKDEGTIPDIGVMDADRKWETITYFLNRVIPVAAEYKVKMALHRLTVPFRRHIGGGASWKYLGLWKA